MSRMSPSGPAEPEPGTENPTEGEASDVAGPSRVGMRNACCATMLRVVLELIAQLVGLAGVHSEDEDVKALGKVHIALSDEERYISVRLPLHAPKRVARARCEAMAFYPWPQVATREPVRAILNIILHKRKPCAICFLQCVSLFCDRKRY